MLRGPNSASLLEFHQSKAKKESALAVDVTNSIEMPAEEGPELEPNSTITKKDFIITSYTGECEELEAAMIVRDIINGPMLDEDVWINDECINCYLRRMLQNLAVELKKEVLLLATYFFQRLFFDNASTRGYFEMNYENALTYWADGEDIIIIPINIQNEHWTMISVSKKMKTINYYDSLGCYKRWHGGEFIDAVLTFMQQYETKQNGNKFDACEWTVRTSKEMYETDVFTEKYTEAPQKNGFDCGLFVLKFAEDIIRGSTASVLGITVYPNRKLIKRHFVGLYIKFRTKQCITVTETLDLEDEPQTGAKEKSDADSVASVPTVASSVDFGSTGDDASENLAISAPTVDSSVDFGSSDDDTSNNLVASVPAVASSGGDSSVLLSASDKTRVHKRSKAEESWGTHNEIAWKKAKNSDRDRGDIVLRCDDPETSEEKQAKDKASKRLSATVDNINLSSINTDGENVDALLSKNTLPAPFDDNISELSLGTADDHGSSGKLHYCTSRVSKITRFFVRF